MNNCYLDKNVNRLHKLNKNIDFEEYKKITTRILNTIPFSRKYKNNSDVFYTLVCTVMDADSTFNGMGTLAGFRRQSVLWKIGVIRRSFNRKKNRTLSLDKIYEDTKIAFVDKKTKHNYINSKEEVQHIFYIVETFPGFPKRARKLLELRYLKNMTFDEIAAQIGCTRQNVEQTLSRTINRLRAILNVNPKRLVNRQTS